MKALVMSREKQDCVYKMPVYSMQKYSNNFWVHLLGKTDYKIIIIVQVFQIHDEGCTYGFFLNLRVFFILNLMVPRAFQKTQMDI